MDVKLDQYDLSGCVIILTGATDGIGKEMARILSGFNPKRLILPVRNQVKASRLLGFIRSSNGHADNIEIWDMDLADLTSVKNFANKFINEVGELHMLFNNAGVCNSTEVTKTKDNLEMQFQVNHLAPFLLTRMLIDTMKTSVSPQSPGKIVFTSSKGHEYGEIDFDNLNLEKGPYWRFYQAYSNNKLMNVLLSNELSRIFQKENANILTYSMHPGMIKTNISGMTDFSMAAMTVILKFFGKSPEQGATNILYPVFKKDETGKYYDEGLEHETNKLADDQELAKRLWNVSEQLLKDHGMI